MHKWGDPDRSDIHRTIRVCKRCGFRKVTRHEYQANGFPDHWVEFEDVAGVRIDAHGRTPRCEGSP